MLDQLLVSAQGHRRLCHAHQSRRHEGCLANMRSHSPAIANPLLRLRNIPLKVRRSPIGDYGADITTRFLRVGQQNAPTVPLGIEIVPARPRTIYEPSHLVPIDALQSSDLGRRKILKRSVVIAVHGNLPQGLETTGRLRVHPQKIAAPRLRSTHRTQ